MRSLTKRTARLLSFASDPTLNGLAGDEAFRAFLRRREDGVVEAIKFPREGAGLLSSLVETDGLVELGEAVTRVELGETVGFLGYASLL